jgi:two-component system nitrogen regulation sensor histidine kinase NtrY
MLTQQEEGVSLIVPPEDVVLEISSIISSDVNLYQDGRIISSSRREFFDYGLLPDLIDGEIYYKIQYENNPYYTQTQKIGDYSFHTLTTSYSLGDSLLLISLPFPLEQQEISKATEELIEFLFFISVFFIAVVLVFARGIGHMIVTPIRKLLVGTREVSSGNLEITITHKPEDEMKTLIEGFNTMIKNLKKHQQELTDMSKKVAWAEMARKIAHEIKNPLTPIQLSAEHLLRVYKDKKKNFEQALQESASYIIKEVDNLRKIAQEFLETSKEAALRKEPFDMKELIQETLDPYKKMISERIKIKENYLGRDFQFLGDRSKIMIALRNLFINAIEAIPDKGVIEISAREDKDRIKLEVRDTGIGIGKGMLERIFEPDFSTKDVGTGLGLPICKKIVEDHGGSILVSSQEKKGTQILITLPRKK